MHRVLKNVERSLVSLSAAEADAIVHALKYALETNATFGRDVEQKALFRSLIAGFQEACSETPAYEKSDVWADAFSVMIRAITVFGDAVEMSTAEAETLMSRLQCAIEKAS